MAKNYIDLDSSVLYRCNQKYYDKVLSEYDLGYSQFVFLASIYEQEGITMSELAANGSFDKGSITKAIQKLIDMDFVHIENSEDDKRSKKLYTTEKTRELMPKLYLVRQEWVSYLTNDLTEDEKLAYNIITDKLLVKAREYAKTNLSNEEIKFYGFQKLTLLDYPGNMAATVFTGGCNFRCPFCHNKQLVYLSQNEVEISKDEILTYLKQRKNVLDGLCISGGEPLLHEGIVQFIKEVKSIGLKIKLDTNGTNFEKLKYLIDEKLVDYVAMDIKNEKKLYPLTVGLENFDTKEIEKSVEYLKLGKVDYEFRTTIVKEYHEDTNFEEVGKWLNGTENYYLQNIEDHGSCIKEGLHEIGEEKLIEIRNQLKKYIKNVSIRGLDEEGK